MNIRFVFKLFFLLILCSFLPALSLDEAMNSLQSISPGKPMQFRWDPLFRNGTFIFGDHHGSFNISAKEGEKGFLLVNNQEVLNVQLPYSNGGHLVFPQEFVTDLRNVFTRLHENDTANFRIATIIIDPGHGGRDPGAVGSLLVNARSTPVYEKDIVLNVALKLRDKLTASYPDKQILMTRSTDVYRTLEQRSDMANNVIVRDNEAIIFISIHANASRNNNARGYEVWHITEGHRRSLLDSSRHNVPSDISAIWNAMLEEEYAVESRLLADSILGGFNGIFGNTLPSRGRKANDWFVVRNSRMPAVLVELGFVSNRQDTLLMTNENGLQRFTDSLYNGISNFIGIFERK